MNPDSVTPETCTKCHLWCKNGDAALGSLLFICIQEKVHRDRCQTGLSFSHWQPLIMEALSMPCSVKTPPIFLKLAQNVIFGARMETPLWVLCFSFAFKKKSSVTGAKQACLSVTCKRSLWRPCETSVSSPRLIFSGKDEPWQP